MISTKASDQELAGYVANIVAAYRAATADQRARGSVWYRVAHDLAEIIGNGDVIKGAGVIAALSPQCGWSRNVTLARQCAAGDIRGQVENSLAKVRAILAGADPAAVLPMELKTGQFYACISNPADPDAVVIDRHAHDIAVGERYGERDRGLSNRNRYATLAAAYRLAAAQLGELPQVVQAVTWVRQTEISE